MVGNYGQAGEIVRTDSKPRTETHEAEHFIAAMLRAQGVSEAVMSWTGLPKLAQLRALPQSGPG